MENLPIRQISIYVFNYPYRILYIDVVPISSLNDYLNAY